VWRAGSARPSSGVDGRNVKRGWGALISTLILVAFITPALTTARFTSRSPGFGSTFAVGGFTPSVAPVPAVSVEGSAVRLRWPVVNFPGTSTVAYRVRRTAQDGSTSEVCTGSSSPSVANGETTCLDASTQSGTSYTYAVQPQLLRNGTPTWSLSFSQESSTVALQGLIFAGAGPVVNARYSEFVTVQFPPGTEAGDLVVLVVVNGRNSDPLRPTGWTEVVSRGIGGSQDFHLYSAQRISDGSNSVRVGIDARNDGASLQVFRYDVPAGSAAPTVRASQTQSGSTSNSSSQLVPTPNIVTTAPATAISIVAVRDDNSLSLVPGSSWVLRSASTSKPGSTSLAWALADTTVGAASTVTSPTWQQSGTPRRWLFGGTAFG
jgi:hypothetical protein